MMLLSHCRSGTCYVKKTLIFPRKQHHFLQDTNMTTLKHDHGNIFSSKIHGSLTTPRPWQEGYLRGFAIQILLKIICADIFRVTGSWSVRCKGQCICEPSKQAHGSSSDMARRGPGSRVDLAHLFSNCMS